MEKPLAAPQTHATVSLQPGQVASDAQHPVPSASNRQFRNDPTSRRLWGQDLEVNSMSTAQPWPFREDISQLPRHFLRQILGLNPFRTSYFALYRPLKTTGARLILFAAIFFSVAAGLPLPLIGVVFGKIIDGFPQNEDALRIRLTQLVGVASAYFLVTWGWAVCWGIVGERVSRGLREALVERAVGMELAYFDVEAPDMTNVLTEKTQTIQLGTSEKVGLFIQSISYFVAAFAVGFILNAKLAGILFAAVIPSMAVVVIFGTKQVSKYSKLAANVADEAAGLAESAIRAVQVVQAFGALQTLSDNHLRIMRSKLALGIRKAIAGALMLGCVYFLAFAANALAFWEGHRQQMESKNQGAPGAGTVYAVVFLILDASFVVGQFGPFIQTLALAAAAGEKVFSLIDHPEAHINVYSSDGEDALPSLFADGIQFKDVIFTYPARTAVRVLDGLSLTFKGGAVNGVVGSSGSGKSTIVSLLLRFYDPSSGRILLGSKDIREYNIKSLRSQIAIVEQEPVLFSGSILDNIRYGIVDSDQFSPEEVVERCTQAAIDANCDFISALPYGMNTIVGGSGPMTSLSGGQLQRIALARAFVRKPALLILDEYTSAMDATSESLVLEALKEAANISNMTIVVIAHRLATVMRADKIIVMGEGAVIEEGNHSSLIARQGYYSRLVEAQQFTESNSSSSEHSETSKLARPSPASKAIEEHLSAKISHPAQSEEASLVEVGALQLLSRCLSFSKPDLPYILLGLSASIVCGAVVIGEAVVFGNLVPILNDKEGSSGKAGFFCLMFFILAIIAFFAYAVSGSAFGVVSEKLVLRVQTTSLRTILTQDLAWFDNPKHSPQSLMSMLNMDTGHISGLSGVILGVLFSGLTSIIGGIVLAHAIAWKIAIIIAGGVPVMIIAGFLRLRVLAKAEKRHENAYNEAAALASEACTAIRTVAALGREADVLRLYRQSIKGPYEQSLKFTIGGNVFLAFSLSVTYFVYALAYWWGARLVRAGEYTSLQFFIVLPALLFSAQAAGQLFSLSPEIARAKAGARSVFDLHDQKPSIMTQFANGESSISEVALKCSETHSEAEKRSTTPHGLLQFREVDVVYPSRPNLLALKNLTLDIQPGEFVGFVGRSGAGKSTTISLIERFYDPTSGCIFLGGQDIRSATVQQHRARIALVSQESFLFSGSVEFNIGLGAVPGTKTAQEQIVNVCRRIGIHDFIMGLPEGYKTECGSNGCQLSGGQRQRIAIARALIRDPEILLLDEATSQLDGQSELEVRKAIAAAASGRTTIMVAHRLASVQDADRIYVFDGGEVVEQGNHAELLAKDGMDAAMVDQQRLR